MILSQIAEFKQFLFDNFSSVGLIALITTICVVVLSFAMREVLSWFTKTDKVSSEVRHLRKEIKFLQGDIKSLSDRLAHISSAPHAADLNSKEAPSSVNEKASVFPLNH